MNLEPNKNITKVRKKTPTTNYYPKNYILSTSSTANLLHKEKTNENTRKNSISHQNHFEVSHLTSRSNINTNSKSKSSSRIASKDPKTTLLKEENASNLNDKKINQNKLNQTKNHKYDPYLKKKPIQMNQNNENPLNHKKNINEINIVKNPKKTQNIQEISQNRSTSNNRTNTSGRIYRKSEQISKPSAKSIITDEEVSIKLID